MPSEENKGWPFIAEYTTRKDESHFLKAVKGNVRQAALPEEIALQSLRCYSLNHLAKDNLLAAQTIAGQQVAPDDSDLQQTPP